VFQAVMQIDLESGSCSDFDPQCSAQSRSYVPALQLEEYDGWTEQKRRMVG